MNWDNLTNRCIHPRKYTGLHDILPLVHIHYLAHIRVQSHIGYFHRLIHLNILHYQGIVPRYTDHHHINVLLHIHHLGNIVQSYLHIVQIRTVVPMHIHRPANTQQEEDRCIVQRHIQN